VAAVLLFVAYIVSTWLSRMHTCCSLFFCGVWIICTWLLSPLSPQPFNPLSEAGLQAAARSRSRKLSSTKFSVWYNVTADLSSWHGSNCGYLTSQARIDLCGFSENTIRCSGVTATLFCTCDKPQRESRPLEWIISQASYISRPPYV
jgi:hypothetical protein